MTVLDLQIAASGDDGYYNTSSGDSFNSIQNAVVIGTFGSSVSAWFRRGSVTIAFGATIDAGYLRVHASSNQSGAVSTRIYGIAEDNPSAPSSAANARSRTRSTAYTAWSPVTFSSGTFYNSPSIVAVLQELIDRPNWTSGGTLMLTWQHVSGSDDRQATAYDGNPANAATLHIEYTDPPNTAPSITVAPAVSYGSRNRLGPNNSPAVVAFTATDPEETGADALSYTIRTAASGGGTLVVSGACTSGVTENVNIPYNASGLSGNGSQTLYLRVSDGAATDEESFVLLQDNASPTVGTISHTPNPVTSVYTVTFTLTDTQSTSAGELALQVRTAATGAGTLLVSGTATSAAEVTTGTINDAALVDGMNTRYLYVTDGAGNALDQSFTVEADLSNPLPVLAGINPTSKAATTSGFILTATGSDFVGASVVRWDGVDLVTTFVSDTTLTATVDAALIASESTASVTVFSPAPDGGESAAQTFTIGPPPPTSSITVASVRESQPRFYLAIYPPAGSQRSRDRLDVIDINPSVTGLNWQSSIPGGWSQLTAGLDHNDTRYDQALADPRIPRYLMLADFAHVELTDGGLTLYEGRLEDRNEPPGGARSLVAKGYGYTALRDMPFLGTSTTPATSGQVLRTILASAASTIRLATGDEFVDPQVSHMPAEFIRLFPSQALDQIAKEGDIDGNLMDWAVWAGRTLTLKPRIAPSIPDYWLPFETTRYVTGWTRHVADRVGIVWVEHTVDGVLTVTGPEEDPRFVDEVGFQRGVVLKAGEIAVSAALRLASTFLGYRSRPRYTGEISIGPDDTLIGAGGQPVPSYLARAGQWVQVGDHEPLIVVTQEYNANAGRLKLQIGDRVASYQTAVAGIMRDVELQKAGTNPVGGRTR